MCLYYTEPSDSSYISSLVHKMRTRKCCVVGCNNKREDAFLHYFPVSDEKRLTKWLDCINCRALKTYSREKLGERVVCHIHFEKRFIKPNSRLRYGAYPSLFTPEEISTGLPNVPIEDIPNKYEQPTRKEHSDHTYFKVEESHSDAEPLSLTTETASFVQASTSSKAEASVSCSDAACTLMTETASFAQATTCSKAEGVRLTVLKTPKVSRKKLISKINDLTPKCAKLYKEYNKAKNQVDFLKRAKRALKFSKENSFEEMTKNINPYAKKIMDMQIRLCTKKKEAHRFSGSEKLIALSVMKQSPKCYRFLQKIFILPSKSTLNKLISQLNIEVRINPVLIEVMKKEIGSWDSNKKFCSITFDEMHLTEGLNFNNRKDEIDDKHGSDQFLLIVTRFAIHNWCNTINKILKGTDIVRLEMRVGALPEIQKKALENYKKKYKNK